MHWKRGKVALQNKEVSFLKSLLLGTERVWGHQSLESSKSALSTNTSPMKVKKKWKQKSKREIYDEFHWR